MRICDIWVMHKRACRRDAGTSHLQLVVRWQSYENHMAIMPLVSALAISFAGAGIGPAALVGM